MIFILYDSGDTLEWNKERKIWSGEVNPVGNSTQLVTYAAGPLLAIHSAGGFTMNEK